MEVRGGSVVGWRPISAVGSLLKHGASTPARAERGRTRPGRSRRALGGSTLRQLAPKLLPRAAVAFDHFVFDVEFEFECERYRVLIGFVARQLGEACGLMGH